MVENALTTVDAVQMLAQLGDTLERKRRIDESLRFMFEYVEEWREKYPNSWVAVHGCRLVAVEPEWTQLTRSIEDQDVDLKEVQVVFVTEKPHLFML